MRFWLLLILVCSVSVCVVAQDSRSTTCLLFRSAMLQSDTMCLPTSSPQLLIFVNEIFCSQCLSALDNFLSSNKSLGCDYVILFVGSVRKSYVNSKLANLRRLIRDTNRLRFVELTVPEKLGVSSDPAGSPYILIQSVDASVLVPYSELFSHDVGGRLTINESAITKAYEAFR